MSDRLIKVEGAGNDFLLGTGAWAERLQDDTELVVRLCDRRRGVGADGVLAVFAEGSNELRVVYRNSDGTLASFCANGTRCAARAAVELLGCSPSLFVETGWCRIPARVADSRVSLDLPAPDGPPRPLSLEAEGVLWQCWWIEVGVPHVVIVVDDLAAVDFVRVAPQLRHHADLPAAGANVNIVTLHSNAELSIRSFERGVEAETLCCGSGVVASSLLAMAEQDWPRVECHPASGDALVVEALAEPPMSPTRLIGPARFVADIEPSPELLSVSSD